LNTEETQRRFELLALPHLDAAYNLARWLTRDDHDASDVVQEAFVRALRYVGGFRGDNARSWLLQIVRNTCFTWLKENRSALVVGFEDHEDGSENGIDALVGASSEEPETAALRNADRAQINQAIATLPIVYREVLVLRELEECSYSDIARIADVPIGTVMSRLARARALMRKALSNDTRPALRAVPRGTQAVKP
jgi:RNA polymerase sigma-70 factor, ECF subfamily